MSHQPNAQRPLPDNTQHSQAADIHALECVASDWQIPSTLTNIEVTRPPSLTATNTSHVQLLIVGLRSQCVGVLRF